ncbi:hypothetical protein PJL18_04331 [Paenarthrobacter nicotinovorans]|nr:hypothetical protein [Paenarthrobacter nicotinovorans]
MCIRARCSTALSGSRYSGWERMPRPSGAMGAVKAKSISPLANCCRQSSRGPCQSSNAAWGWRPRNALIRRGRVASPNVCWNETPILPRTTSDSWRTRSRPAWKSSSAASMYGRRAFAAEVRRIPRPSRTNRSIPTIALARATALLTVDCGTPSNSAVSVICSVRPSSARTGRSGRSWTSCW